jgi:hypothetical protein
VFSKVIRAAKIGVRSQKSGDKSRIKEAGKSRSAGKDVLFALVKKTGSAESGKLHQSSKKLKYQISNPNGPFS